MNRRVLIGAAVFWPLAATAQQAVQMPASVIRIVREQAEIAAAQIGQFISEIEREINRTTATQWASAPIEQRRPGSGRLLRQVPAIIEFVQLDPAAKERLRVSRRPMDVIGGQTDYSQDPKFTVAMAKKAYYGPVHFTSGSDPYMTLSLAGANPDAGVSVVEVNLKAILDIVMQVRIGERGIAYILDVDNRVIAHRDISLLQRDFSSLGQVRAARGAGSNVAAGLVQAAQDIHGRDVIAAFAAVAPLAWLVFVELPAEEANGLAQ